MVASSDLKFDPLSRSQLGLTQAAITAAGTTNADATLMKSQITYYVITATGSDGIKLASDTPLLTPIFLANPSGSNCLLYPGTGCALNGGTATTGTETIGTTTVAIVIRTSSTAYSVLLGA